MKSAQVRFDSNSNFQNQVAQIEKIAPQLVILFGSPKMFESGGLAGQICKHFGKVLTIGCTTAGEISNSGISDDTLIVTGAHFDSEVRFHPISSSFKSMDTTQEAGLALGRQLDKKNLKGVFVLGRGLDINGSALLDGIRQVLGADTVITGGLAGDSGRFQKTFTILNGNVSDSSVVGFGLYGESVHMAYGSRGGWDAFGPVRKVTKANQNVLFELDGKPALEIYKTYLGERAKDLPASALLYPFAVLKDNKDQTGVIRTILGVDEKTQSVTLAGDISVGGFVRLMHSNNKNLVNGARNAATAASDQIKGEDPHGLGVLISCVGRKLVMGTDVEDELDAVKEVFGDNCDITGFYSYGEICPAADATESKLHNQTMTVTYFYEAA